MQHYDVIVVGAGLVGRILLRALKTLPLKVACIEKNITKPHRDPRSITLSPSSVKLLKRLDLWSLFQAHVTPIGQIKISHEKYFGVTSLQAEDVGADALGYVIAAQKLYEILESPVADVDIYCPATIQTMQEQDDGLKVVLDDERVLSTKLLIANDGKNSSVRQHLGIKATAYSYAQQACVGVVKVSQPHHQRAYEKMLTDGALALLPRQGRHMGVVWVYPQAHQEEVDKMSESALLMAMNQRFGARLGVWQSLTDIAQFPLSASRIQQLTSSRVVFLGNAALTMHPIAGQGLNLAWRDVMVLTAMLQQALVRSDDIGHQDLLDRYAKERFWDHKKMFHFTHYLQQAGQRLNPLRNLLSHTVMASLDNLPMLKRSFLRFTMGEDLPMTHCLSGWIHSKPWRKSA